MRFINLFLAVCFVLFYSCSVEKKLDTKKPIDYLSKEDSVLMAKALKVLDEDVLPQIRLSDYQFSNKILTDRVGISTRVDCLVRKKVDVLVNGINDSIIGKGENKIYRYVHQSKRVGYASGFQLTVWKPYIIGDEYLVFMILVSPDKTLVYKVYFFGDSTRDDYCVSSSIS